MVTRLLYVPRLWTGELVPTGVVTSFANNGNGDRERFFETRRHHPATAGPSYGPAGVAMLTHQMSLSGGIGPSLVRGGGPSVGSSSIGEPSGISGPGTGGIFSSASSIDARYVEELENDFFELEDRYDNLQHERERLASEIEGKTRSIEELQGTLEQYREKLSSLERRCNHLEDEIKGYRILYKLKLACSSFRVGGGGLINWFCQVPGADCLGPVTVRLCEGAFGSPSCTANPSILNFHPSCDGHRQGRKLAATNID
ncbi:unnamed protein product [Protopolystoma xenopodis]|uniref:Uncharacterized protein n=1 Tax=Protopolystoma xenopodis TaxID=117903 RepID=A0A448XGV7_9PLAT|nr:unnamed protein product [Protopolystoma xenopodis]